MKKRGYIMIKQERRERIVNQIKQKRLVKVQELVEEYQVSIETIRRDLEYLEKMGHLKRVYGGAVAHGLYSEEPAYSHREIINFHEKRAIARKTAQLISDGDTLFIEVGTTALEVALCLREKKNLTVITNALAIAQALMESGNTRVILLGGELRPGELATSGSMADHDLQMFYANKAIIGVGGISLDRGITDYHFGEAGIRRSMIAHADEIIAVTDYSKFGVVAMNRVCSLAEVDVLVTDWSVPAKVLGDYRAQGLQVLVAPPLSEEEV